MVALTYIIENANSDEPRLHVEWCTNVGPIIVVLGTFVGCFTAMRSSKAQYQHIEPCPYCCGALL